MSSTIPVGVDLGTSYCAASYIDADGRSQMILNDEGEVLTPSVVHFADDQVAIGRQAWHAAALAPDRVAENAKRDMGMASYRQQIGGQHYPPEVIQSCILRQLRRDVINAVGEDFQAVITVPAYFDEARRKATFDAAIMSGLAVLDIVNEPTAAALSFGERLGYLTPEGAPRECLNVLVYDLGGGTFDVTVIQLSTAELRTLATDGDYELGGVNWDQRLAEHAEARLRALRTQATPLGRTDQIRLLRAAQTAKHALTSQPVTVLEFNRGDQPLKLPITRDEFEELTSDLLERTVFTTRQALQAAGLLWSDVDRLLLVGGSSRMPAVQRVLSAASGMAPDAAVNPDEAVARGAAIFARYLLGLRSSDAKAPKLRITDVNSHGLGIEGVNLQTLREENVALIPRNTPLPCEVKRSFVTRTEGQPNVKIKLLEGESTLPAQCSQLATARIRNLPPGLPKGTPIEVRYSLHANGRLSISAAVPGHGEDAQIELQRVRGLADRRVQGWQKIVCRDGGYRDFEEALAVLCAPEATADVDAVDGDAPAAAGARKTPNFDPAVEYGAPQAASDSLRSQYGRPATARDSTSIEVPVQTADAPKVGHRESPAIQVTRKRARRRTVPDLVGHVIGALVGLSLGYYALCWVRPDLNFLGLNLPGIEQVDRGVR